MTDMGWNEKEFSVCKMKLFALPTDQEKKAKKMAQGQVYTLGSG